MLRAIVRRARAARRNARDAAQVVRGALHYVRTGETPPAACQSLINLYCATGGLSNDAMHAVQRARRRPLKLPSNAGVLGDFTAPDVRAIANRLDRDGYYVFPRLL